MKKKKTSALISPRVTMEERRRSLKAALACPITPNPSQTHHHYHHSCRSQFNPSLLNLTSSQQKITFEKITISYHFMLRAYPFRAFVQWETVWWGAQFSSWWCRLTVLYYICKLLTKDVVTFNHTSITFIQEQNVVWNKKVQAIVM